MVKNINMILGHRRQIKYLEQVLKNGRFAHAYLFSGPEGVGKFSVAKAAAKFFYCQNYQGMDRSDECNQCKLIEENLHPQVVILDPENTLVSKKDTRKEIPIVDIRELKRRLAFAPAGEQWRVVIINQADKMSKEAEAAFLKLLEEPGSKVLFILVSASKDNLSQTIISRTQVINFSLLPAKVLEGFLQDRAKEPELAREIVLLARGRAGIILKLLGDKNVLEEERKFLKEVEGLLKKADLAEVFHFSEKVAAQDELRQKVPVYLILALRKRLLESRAASSQKIGFIRSLKKIQRIWQIMETTNVNSRLALDAMFIEAQYG